MYLLKRTNNKPVILIGSGLIGLSIINEFIKIGYDASEQKKIDWGKPDEDITESIIDYIKENYTQDLAVVWSAGKCGFNSCEAEIEVEKKLFIHFSKSVNTFLNDEDKKLSFYLISSIGGLFEGQIGIYDEMTPAPIRPYGRLKSFQEQTLLTMDEKVEPYIFRLSSVYGSVNHNHRMGLIQVLINNGIYNFLTKIYGSVDTLRDYTYVGDISRFICNVIASYNGEIRVFHLANGKPSSIREIQKIVEKKVHKKLLLSYKLNRTNDLDITCKFNSYGGLWQPSGMKENIGKLYDWVVAK